MQIAVQKLGKRFGREWIFRNIHADFVQDRTYAITGPNGSGKSTLLQVLAGYMPASEGQLTYLQGAKAIADDQVYRQISMAAPYLELVEEFTLAELIDFHFRFKNLKAGYSKQDLIDILRLGASVHKPVRYYSSGMKQRLKLGLALFADTPVLLLDEPTANLDATGIAWYRTEIHKHLAGRIVLICSNQEYEFDFCDHIIPVNNYQNQTPQIDKPNLMV